MNFASFTQPLSLISGMRKREIAVRRRHRIVADFDADEVLVKFADHETQQRFLHRHDDFLSFAGALAGVQRGENAAYHADAGGFVANADRFGARRSVVAPARVGPTGHAVVGMRRAAVVFVRPRLAEAARARIDDARIDLFKSS